MSDKPRKRLAFHGRRGAWVKVFLEKGHERVRVQWKDAGGMIETRTWPNTKANKATAIAFGEGRAEALVAGETGKRPRLTLLALWELYTRAEFPHLRPRSRELYRENFRRWALVWGWEFIADDTNLEMADEFRRRLTSLGLAVNTIAQTIRDVRRVYNWGEGRELLERNRLRVYRFKVAKEDRPTPPPEFRLDDFLAILRQLDPSKSTQWRPFVALALCGYTGRRQSAVLHLCESDVRLGLAEITPTGPVWQQGAIRFRPEWDKLGKDLTVPLRIMAQVAVEIALEWRDRIGYDGPWLLPPGSSKNTRAVYSTQSLWMALCAAETRAGIDHEKGRGAHGLRRMLAGDVTAQTGDFMLGLQAIGDSDPRMATRYIQARTDRIADAFTQLDAPQPEGSKG